MNQRLITHSTKLLKLKRVSTSIIITTAVLSAVVAFVTVYASQVGNFVIRAENEQYKLALSETPDFADAFEMLTAQGVSSMLETTYGREGYGEGRIDVDYIKSVDGNFNSKTHFGYSFYIKNLSNTVININMLFTIPSAYKNVDNAVWIMIIQQREGMPEESTIYAKAQTKGSSIGQPENCLGFQTTPFLSNKTVLNNNIINVRQNEVIRYTIIMWLEGWDADCTDEIKLGSVRFDLLFSAYDDKF